MLGSDDWYSVDVITCAAPEMFYNYDEAKYRSVITKRIKRILDVAGAQNIEVLILGAFGCGAFRNPPQIVASVFNELIRDYNFETVEFAVYCGLDTTNYDVFNKVLSNQEEKENER